MAKINLTLEIDDADLEVLRVMARVRGQAVGLLIHNVVAQTFGVLLEEGKKARTAERLSKIKVVGS